MAHIYVNIAFLSTTFKLLSFNAVAGVTKCNLQQ